MPSPKRKSTRPRKPSRTSPRRVSGGLRVVRISRAFRAGLRRFGKPILGMVVCSALLAAAYMGFGKITQHAYFQVDQVVLVKGQRLGNQEMQRRTAEFVGQNIFDLHLHEVERAVEESPWVAKAHAARDLPNRIKIFIEEEKPAALVILDQPYLANSQGRLFKSANLRAGDGDNLVAITGLSRSFVSANMDATQTVLRSALDVIAQWNSATQRPALSEVHISDSGYQLVTLGSGARIYLGRMLGEELHTRLQRFDLVWSNLSEDERHSATRFHLDSKTRPDRITVGLSMR